MYVCFWIKYNKPPHHTTLTTFHTLNNTTHSPQHTLQYTPHSTSRHTSKHTILPTLHDTLHIPHRNSKPHCRSSNPVLSQGIQLKDSCSVKDNPATKTSSTLPGQTFTLTALARSINWRSPCHNWGSSVML